MSSTLINTKPNPNHINSIKSYKKVFEKWDMWDFAFYNESDYYFLTLYERPLKGISGYLLLDYQGNIVPYQKAKSHIYYLVSYNTMIDQVMKVMVPQMYKNISPFEEVISILKKNRSAIVDSCQRSNISVDKLIEYTTITVSNKRKIKDIVDQLSEYQNKILDENGYFDKAIYDEMQVEYGKYSEIMYSYALRELEMMRDYEFLMNRIKNNNLTIPNHEKNRLIRLLDASIKSNNGSLKNSLELFERDKDGKKIDMNFDNYKEGLKRNREEKGFKYFEEKIAPKIRNPK